MRAFGTNLGTGVVGALRYPTWIDFS